MLICPSATLATWVSATCAAEVSRCHVAQTPHYFAALLCLQSNLAAVFCSQINQPPLLLWFNRWHHKSIVPPTAQESVASNQLKKSQNENKVFVAAAATNE